MDIKQIFKHATELPVDEAFDYLSSLEGVTYRKEEAPYFDREDGVERFDHDFIFKTGDLVTYQAEAGDPAAEGGYWRYSDAATRHWGDLSDFEEE